MAAQLRFSPLHTAGSLAGNRLPLAGNRFPLPGNRFPLAGNLIKPSILTSPISLSLLPKSPNPNPSPTLSAAAGGNSGNSGHRGSGDGDNNDENPDENPNPSDPFGPIAIFLNGWRSRVSADPQFPFKVLMEEIVGVSACVLGDMASRSNFGLNELDFVFSTLVVGSIVNFVLMYLLAPTGAISPDSNLPSFMFESGSFSILDRIGSFAYKGVLFAAVGFAAGIAGTAISNGLISMRKKLDPEFETGNKAPPTVLNAVTWGLHMAVSSNIRYQMLNGVEFLMEKGFNPIVFRVSVVVLRCLNNVLGGMSFVILARLTGSQKVGVIDEGNEELQRSGSDCK